MSEEEKFDKFFSQKFSEKEFPFNEANWEKAAQKIDSDRSLNMSEEEKFDDLFRQKFADKKFIFNEENWEKAAEKIDSGRRLRKIFNWTAIFGIGLIAGVALMFPLVNSKDEKSPIEIAEVSPKQSNSPSIFTENSDRTGKEISEVSKKENKNVEPKENEAIRSQESSKNEMGEVEGETKKEVKAVSNSGSTEKIVVSIPKSKTQSEKTLSKKENKASSAHNEINSRSNPEPTTTTHDRKGEVVKSKEMAKTPSESKKEFKKIIQKEILESAKQKTDEHTSSEKESAMNNGKTPSETNSGETNELEENVEENNTEPVNKSTKDESAFVQPKTEKKKAEEEIKQENNSSVNNPSVKNLSVQKNPETNLNAQAAKKDSVGSSKGVSEKDSVSAENEPKIQQGNTAASAPSSASSLMRNMASADIFSLEAGTNFLFGWRYRDSTEGKREAKGFNPLFGISVTHYFNATWSLYAGLQYGSVGNLNASQKTFSSKNFDFGSSRNDTSVDTKRLYYVMMPFQFQYHFSSKNSIGLGATVSYLLNTKSTITTNSTSMSYDSLSTLFIQTAGASKTETGYYKGAFNKWDVALAVSYKRKIFNKFSAAASLSYGLLDVKSNTFFSREKFERNVGVKIVFAYDLFQY